MILRPADRRAERHAVFAMMGFGVALVAIAAVMGLAGVGRHAPAPAMRANPPLARGLILLDGRPVLRPEVARTPREQDDGLSNRAEVGEAGGMAFPWTDAPAAFWMHETYMPLDIVFVGSGGMVVQISSGQPLDDAQIDVAHPVRFVLELPKGDAERLGIALHHRLELR